GHVGRYLAARGVDVFGLDLSPRMVELARRRNPGIPFEQGDMLALALADASLAGIVAFYSLIHLARDTVARALGELTRVLAPGGRMLIAFHGGSGQVHAEDGFGEKISMRATLFDPTRCAATWKPRDSRWTTSPRATLTTSSIRPAASTPSQRNAVSLEDQGPQYPRRLGTA